MMDTLEKHLIVNRLLEQYRALLTDKQNIIMTYYYVDNYTLQEIADLQDVTRNAVHDHIKKTLHKLNDLEEKLKLLAKSDRRQTLIETLKNKTNSPEIIKLLNALEKVE